LLDDPSACVQSQPAFWVNAKTEIVPLNTGPGIIIGRLFTRDDFQAVDRFCIVGNLPRAMMSSLTEGYWGAYLAILPSEDNRTWLLFRDPSGQLPVYRYETPDHIFFSSDVGLLTEIGLLRPEIDWQALYEHLQMPTVRRARTCLSAITEVSPGALIPAVEGAEPVERIWSPWDHSSPDPYPSFEEAAALLRSSVLGCISAWSAACGTLVVPVSGGLDSSIVCAALAAAGRDFQCMTIATRDPSGDERSYARQLANYFGVRLIECQYDIDWVDPHASAAAHLPRPVMKPFVQATRHAFVAAATSAGARTIFDGNGGDNVFCFLHSSAPIADRLMREGPRREVLHTLSDVSRVTGCPMPLLARMVIKQTMRRKRVQPSPKISFLNEAYPPFDLCEPLSPFLKAPCERQRGKVAHMALILAIQNLVEGYDRSALVGLFSPLLSQPIVETCLAIPSWHWCRNGVNRSVARSAFESLLPPQVVSRISKAGPDSFVHEIFRTYRFVIREILLDGSLAAHGVLDRPQVEAAFQTDDHALGERLYTILDLVDAENWAQSWLARSHAAHVFA
jgi:asparagine synthase (glutamine-hydrolysing)